MQAAFSRIARSSTSSPTLKASLAALLLRSTRPLLEAAWLHFRVATLSPTTRLSRSLPQLVVHATALPSSVLLQATQPMSLAGNTWVAVPIMESIEPSPQTTGGPTMSPLKAACHIVKEKVTVTPAWSIAHNASVETPWLLTELLYLESLETASCHALETPLSIAEVQAP
jgi:hypothetical protein